jgi:hypothetical protein
MAKLGALFLGRAPSVVSPMLLDGSLRKSVIPIPRAGEGSASGSGHPRGAIVVRPGQALAGPGTRDVMGGAVG